MSERDPRFKALDDAWEAADMPRNENPEPDEWTETAIMAVLDLITQEQEGTVVIDVPGGCVCHIKVTFVPGIGMVCNSTGGKS